jgi:hypothetical protein
MKHLVHIFQENKEEIKDYVCEIINKMETKTFSKETLRDYFPLFHSLKSLYMIDVNHKLVTPFYSKEKESNNMPSPLSNKVKLDENGEHISGVYLSSLDHKPTITVTKQISKDELITMNFNLVQLLEELNYLQKSEIFNNMSKIIYGAIGYSLSIFSVILILYSLFNFTYHILDEETNIFHSIFKSTIALTLGLAVFDLAKNLLEHEVIYKEYFIEAHGSRKLLEKFLISIIIALSIEALMTVFKIALADYKDMIYAVYLILAVSVMIFALSFFDKVGHRKDL